MNPYIDENGYLVVQKEIRETKTIWDTISWFTYTWVLWIKYKVNKEGLFEEVKEETKQ